MGNYSSRDFSNAAIIPYPLAFLLDEKLHDLPYTEKEMYAYLKRRMNLSLQNKDIYEDENGLFVIYKQAEIAKELHIGERQVRKTFHGMVEHGLIETKKRGMGLPQKIYLKNVSDLIEQSGTNGAGQSGTNGAGQSGTNGAGQSGTNGAGQSGTNGAGQSGTNGAGQSGTNGAGPYSELKDIRDKRIELRNKREKAGDLILAFVGSNQSLLEALQAWQEMRSKIKAPLTEYAIKLALKKLQTLSGGDECVMVEIINQSVENCYKGFFPLKGGGRMAPKKSKSQSVYESLEALDERRTEKGIGDFG